MSVRQISVGDNLEFLGRLESGSAQLVYMDPPFASGREYKAVLQLNREDGHEISSAFSDTWTSNAGRTAHTDRRLATILSALEAVAPSGVGNYLWMMAPRLSEAWRILDTRGSLIVHCDPSASHYLRILLDTIFGPENFRNEIIWRRTHAHSSSRRFGPVHDVLLYYTRSAKYVWNQPYADYSPEYVAKYYTRRDERGAYQLITCTGPGDRTGTRAHYEWKGALPPAGRHWAWQRERMEELDAAGLLVYSHRGVPRLKRYLDEAPGVALQDVWSDIPRLDAHASERVGYETQKPVALLKRIIGACTDEGALVVDPFAGSGTTAVAAEALGRAWAIGDASLLAASLSLSRVHAGAGARSIDLYGFPGSVRSADALRRSDPATFGAWGTGILGASIDRKRSSKSVTKGAGLLHLDDAATDTRSWVPLADEQGLTIAEPGDFPHGPGVGYVLGRSSSMTSALADARLRHPQFRLRNVTLAEAVSPETRRFGVAATVRAGR